MSRVIIFGGTGRTGRLIAEMAATNGHEVTVASRHPETYSALGAAAPPPGQVSAVRVDVQDPDSVARALQNQDAIILAVSSSLRHPGTVLSDAARNITNAAHTKGLRALVISSGGVEYQDPSLPFWFRRVLVPLLMKAAYDDMRTMEQIVRVSDLDWTIVRASYLNDKPGTGRYRVADATTPQGGWRLSRADLARFTTDQLDNDQWLHKAPTLAD